MTDVWFQHAGAENKLYTLEQKRAELLSTEVIVKLHMRPGTLTILLLLSQNRNFISSWEIQQEQHGLLPNDVRKVHIVHLQNVKQSACSQLIIEPLRR